MRDEINDTIRRRHRRRKLNRGAYIPGMYDKLLTPREWQQPASVLAFIIEAEQYQECPDPGCGELTIIEHTRKGEHPAHHISATQEPVTLELVLADGRLAMIEIMIVAPDAALTGCALSPESMFLDLRESADLLRFSGLEEPEDGDSDGPGE